MAGHRVDGAFDALVDEDLADAGVAVDTGADVFGAVLDELVRQFGVGQHLARHGDEVALAGGDGVVGDLGLEAADGDHRNLHCFLDLGGPQQEAGLLLHQRGLGEGDAGAGVGIGRYADGVAAGGFGHAGEDLGLFQCDAAVHAQLVGVQAQPHRVVGTDTLAHGGNDFAQEAAAVLDRAAVFVVALVEVAGQEARNDVGVRGVDLDTVEARAPGAIGGGGEPFDHLRDVGLVHHADLHAGLLAALGRADEGAEFFLRQRGEHVGLDRRRHGRHPQFTALGEVAHRGLAGVLQLRGDLGAVLVHPVDDALQPGNELVVGDAHLVGLGGTVRVGDGDDAHRQQAGAARRAGLVIGLNAFAAGAVRLGEVGTHRRHDDAVAHLHGADAAGLQQVVESTHGVLTPWSGNRCSCG